jgi:hypothetical protein
MISTKRDFCKEIPFYFVYYTERAGNLQLKTNMNNILVLGKGCIKKLLSNQLKDIIWIFNH